MYGMNVTFISSSEAKYVYFMIGEDTAKTLRTNTSRINWIFNDNQIIMFIGY